mmetsp:Transcript_11284/g.28962  ORF Transcript_11284/g.28962 Transcript_11284/m.28962 type:complete len:185 (+) Transcript_11284:103-657(+)|eukprot:jgi/Tetstr1/434228/TSEL_023339.t1
MTRVSHRAIAVALLLLLSSATAVQAQFAESAAVGAALVVLWIVSLGSVPVFACSLSYGIIGIVVGQSWPNPNCCCYKSPFSGGDAGANCVGCLPLFNTCVTLLVLQSIYTLIDVIIMAVFYVWWFNIISLLCELAALGVLITAIVLLRKGYQNHGQPKPIGTALVHVVQAAPVAGLPPVTTVAF